MSFHPYHPPCPWPNPWHGYYIDAYGVAVAQGVPSTMSQVYSSYGGSMPM